jgi:chromosome segregation ATPase
VADLDAFVLEKVRRTWPIKGEFRQEMFAGLTRRIHEFERREKGLRQRLEALDGAQERFKHDYKAGRLGAEEYMELIREGRAERAELLAALETAQAERQAVLDSQVDLEQASRWHAKLDAWESLTLADKQQILRMLIKEITVARPKGAPDVSVHIEWRLPAPAAAE